MPASASAASIAAACPVASSGAVSSGSISARVHRDASPEAMNARASPSDRRPASTPMPRANSSSHSSPMPSSPWLAVTSSGSSVHADDQGVAPLGVGLDVGGRAQ